MTNDDSSAPRGGQSRRAELKQAYKEKPPPMGIYAVRNLESGKVLLGSSLNAPGMLNRIRFQLEMGIYRVAPALQDDWRRLGPSRFSFEVLDTLDPAKDSTADPREELEELEALWLDRLKPWGEAGYNAQPG